MMLAVLDNQTQTSQVFDKPLQIAIFGFDQRTQQTLEIAFKNIGNNCAAIVNVDRAQAAIFNFDNQESRTMFLNFRREHPGFPIIVISANDIALKGAHVLTKPLRVGKFTEIFNSIQKQLAASPEHQTSKPAITAYDSVPDAPDQAGRIQSQAQPHTTLANNANEKPGIVNLQRPVDKNAAEQPADIYYSPEKHLQSILFSTYREAREKNIVIEINLKVKNDWGSITLFPGLNKVATDFGEQQLKYICSTPMFCFETKVIRYDQVKTKKTELIRRDDRHLIPFETFNWEVALWTSNGRLPEGISLQTPYRLRRWPNFTRLKTIPHAFSMAALLSQKPLNITLFSKVADISQDYIFSFFSCVYATNLLETAACHETNGDLLQNAAQKHPKRGIFERILSKLKIN